MMFRILCAALGVALFATSPAAAQSRQASRRALRGSTSNNVLTGVDLEILGADHASPGQTLRWQLRAYDVFGVETLRPSPRATIEVFATFSPGPIGRLTADEHGRALAEITVPADTEVGENVQVSFFISSPRGAQRRIRFPLSVQSDETLQLIGPPQVSPEGTLHIAGIAQRRTGEALANRPFTLQLHDGRGQLATRQVETDGNGLFLLAYALPRDTQSFVRTQCGNCTNIAATTHNATLRRRPQGELRLQAQGPALPVDSRANYTIDIVLRRADGRPVPNAFVNVNGPVEHLLRIAPEELPRGVLRTDSRGRARWTNASPRFLPSGFEDLSHTVYAAAPGLGQVATSVTVRRTAQSHFAHLSIPAGELTAEIGGQLRAQVVNAAGMPAANHLVQLRGPRIGEHEATTNADGFAAFSVRVGEQGDDCGGEALARVELVVGSGEPLRQCVPVNADRTLAVELPELASLVLAPRSNLPIALRRRGESRNLPIEVLLRSGDTLVASALTGPRQDSLELPIGTEGVGALTIEARPVQRGLSRKTPEATTYALQISAPFPVPAQGALPTESQHRGITVGAQDTPGIAFAVPNADYQGLRNSMLGATTQAPASESEELLRDPRARAELYVAGNLGIVFRRLEEMVAAVQHPSEENPNAQGLRSIAFQQNGRWRFGRELLRSIEIQGAAPETLGGQPLTMDTLEALDSSFGVDAVARRVTRQRLFELMVALRGFVQQGGRDLQWNPPGDPALWLDLEALGHAPRFDAWGNRFVLRRVSRPRFATWQPVQGYEVVSPGPDGRLGNGDDLVDPTASVIDEGSLYGRAVGEELLVARLRTVAFGQQTATALQQALHIAVRPYRHQPTASRPEMPSNLPRPLPSQAPLGFDDPDTFPEVAATLLRSEAQNLSIDSARRQWSLLELRRSGPHWVFAERRHILRGAPFLIRGALPENLRVGEAYETELHITNLGREGTFRLEAHTENISAEVRQSVAIAAEEALSVPITLRAEAPGRASLELQLHHGDDTRTHRVQLRVDRGLHPIRRRASGLVRDRWSVRFPIPETAAGLEGRLIVARPTSLGADPELRQWFRKDPALLAWLHTLGGRAVPAPLRSQLLRMIDQGTVPRHSLGAAAIAVSTMLAAGDQRTGTEATHGHLSRVRSQLRSLNTPAEHAMAAAALLSEANHHHALRELPRTHPDEKNTLARAAAALLLANTSDAQGRALFETLRREHRRGSEDGSRGGLQDREALIGAMALAIAAHQAGDRPLRDSLTANIATEASRIHRNGGEALFWWFAMLGYGVIEDDPGAEVSVVIDGRTHSLDVSTGVATLPIPFEAGSTSRIEVRSDAPVIARTEAVFGVPFEARQGNFALSIEGLARSEESAASALELTIAASEEIDDGIVEIQLPSHVIVTDALLQRLQNHSKVRSAEIRRPHFLRLHLLPFRAEESTQLPLPFRWQSNSSHQGLGIVAYPASAPGEMTVLAPRELPGR